MNEHSNFKILVVGDVCTDVYKLGLVERISPEAPVPVVKIVEEFSTPGMAANVAKNLETLGCRVKLLSAGTSTKTRIIDIKSKQHIVRIDNDVASEPIDIDAVDINRFDAVVVSDYLKGAVDYAMLDYLDRYATVPVFVDTKKTNLGRFSQKLLFKINEQESHKLAAWPSNIIVTRGERGAELNRDRVFPALAAEVVDVCGAGDTFISALVFEYVRHRDIDQAIRFANAAAGISVQHLGVHAPKLEDIESYLDSSRY